VQKLKVAWSLNGRTTERTVECTEMRILSQQVVFIREADDSEEIVLVVPEALLLFVEEVTE